MKVKLNIEMRLFLYCVYLVRYYIFVLEYWILMIWYIYIFYMNFLLFMLNKICLKIFYENLVLWINEKGIVEKRNYLVLIKLKYFV